MTSAPLRGIWCPTSTILTVTPPQAAETVSYPRRAALTRQFRSGAPRLFTLSPDGQRLLFLRSSSDVDSVESLYQITLGDHADSTEQLVVDPRGLLDTTDADLDPVEKARRERMRETSTGITSYDTDAAVSLACMSIAGSLVVAALADRDAPPIMLSTDGYAVDPRISPSGEHIAYVVDRALHVIDLVGGNHRILCSATSDDQAVGLADFIAAEEFSRSRGHWWAPDSRMLLVEEYDESEVTEWWISDPAQPEKPSVGHRYPRAGTPNASVRLWLVSLDGSKSEIDWDHDVFPYLVSVHWSKYGDPLITVLSRDQRTQRIFTFNPVDASTSTVVDTHDECWVATVPGLPCRGPAGVVAHLVDDTDDDTRRIRMGDIRSPGGLQIRAVFDCDESGLLIAASTDATQSHLYSLDWSGRVEELTTAEGWQLGRRASDSLLVVSHSLDLPGATAVVHRTGATTPIASRAGVPPIPIHPALVRVGSRELNTAVLFPPDSSTTSSPVVMWPYGGPGHVEVMSAQLAYADAQWLANQGFVVVIGDGRGTPGRGPAWERAVHGDLVTPVLDDQVAVLHGVAEMFPGRLDLSRVGITGWSFGGYLAALAVMRRPDVFHVAVAGAPVTDWRLYDTAYSERYLGHPDTSEDTYEACSLLPLAPQLSRPLMLIHGFADDNVVIAHSLRLSAALTAAGRPHTFLPLSGVTHMTPQVEVAENLMLLQLDFLRTHLAIVERPPSS